MKGSDTMENLIRIENIEINGIKNVSHGEIVFKEYSEVLKGNFDNLTSVLGIYGQNGSGKTTVLEVTKLLKNILVGNKLPDNFSQFISNQCEEVELSFTFFVQVNECQQLITYSLNIRLVDEDYEIYHEKITSKEYSIDEKKWETQITLVECENKKITLKKLMNKISNDKLIELRVAQDIEKGTSFIFNKRNREILLDVLNDDNKLSIVLKYLSSYAKVGLIIIENDVMGSINLTDYASISLYLENKDTLTTGKLTINLLESNEMPLKIYENLETVMKQVDIVLHALIPSLHLKITNQKQTLLSDGNDGITFDIVSVRDEKMIPLKYESEGIKRLISVISSMIAAFNNPSVCLMIDEFDSGVFEYLLGEIIEIIDESAKGQFLFTSHNLR